MITSVWDWLPDSAISAPGTLERLDGAVEAWSRRWFVDDLFRRRQLIFSGPSAARAVVASTALLSLRGDSAALDILAGCVLDLDLSRLEIGDGDRSVIDALGDALVKDLAEGLEVALTADDLILPSPDRSGGVLIELADDDGRRLLEIETTRAVLAAARRSRLPSRRPPRGGPLASLRSAVADAPVRLAATVGSAVISLSDARRLAPGDVIVLDRMLEEPIDLLAEAGARIACARLTDAASPRSLRLEAVTSGDPK